MKNKKILLLILALTLVFCAFVGCSNGGLKDLSVNSFSYKITASKDAYVLTSVATKRGNDLVVPDTYEGLPVVEIASGAFLNKSNVTKITIGANVRVIGSKAFAGCTSLSTYFWVGARLER